MGASLKKSFHFTDWQSAVKFGLLGVLLPSLSLFSIYRYLSKKPDHSIKPLNLSYDQDDDLDETSIISILDAQFQMGPLQILKEEFN